MRPSFVCILVLALTCLTLLVEMLHQKSLADFFQAALVHECRLTLSARRFYTHCPSPSHDGEHRRRPP